MKAMALAVSMAEPPPQAITPSFLAARRMRTPASTLAATGLGLTSLKSAASRPALRSATMASAIIGNLASPGSVTNNGRLRPTALHASGSSRMRPAPNRIAVG